MGLRERIEANHPKGRDGIIFRSAPGATDTTSPPKGERGVASRFATVRHLFRDTLFKCRFPLFDGVFRNSIF